MPPQFLRWHPHALGGPMRPERVRPLDQTPETATTKGPQLVPARAAPAEVPIEAVEIKEPHPMLVLFIVAVIAFTGASIFVGTIVTALLLRFSGVNWFFE